jgi:hypothetical protein
MDLNNQVMGECTRLGISIRVLSNKELEKGADPSFRSECMTCKEIGDVSFWHELIHVCQALNGGPLKWFPLCPRTIKDLPNAYPIWLVKLEEEAYSWEALPEVKLRIIEFLRNTPRSRGLWVKTESLRIIGIFILIPIIILVASLAKCDTLACRLEQSHQEVKSLR